MALTRAQLAALIAANLPNNVSKLITPAKHREVEDALTDAAVNVEDDIVVASAGAGDAAKIPALDGTGKLDASVIPGGGGGAAWGGITGTLSAQTDLQNALDAKVNTQDSVLEGAVQINTDGNGLAITSEGNQVINADSLGVGLRRPLIENPTQIGNGDSSNIALINLLIDGIRTNSDPIILPPVGDASLGQHLTVSHSGSGVQPVDANAVGEIYDGINGPVDSISLEVGEIVSFRAIGTAWHVLSRYISSSAGSPIQDLFAGDGVEDVFTLSESPVGGTLDLTVNGLQQEPLVDYTVGGVGNKTITFQAGHIPPAPGAGQTNNIIANYGMNGAGSGGGDMFLASVQTVTGAKTFGSAGAVGKLKIAGTTSGEVTLDAPAVAGSGTVSLPATGTLATIDGTETLTNKSIVATQLTGTIAAARMPALTGPVSTSAGAIATTLSWVIQVAASDVSTAITTGTAKATFRMPFAGTLTAVRASVNTAPTGATIVIDINETGTTVLSTKLSIDTTEKTSTTAATPPVISDSSLADDAEITIDFDQVGSTIAGAGVVVTLIGTRTA